MTHEPGHAHRMFREEAAAVDWRRLADRQRERLPLADALWRVAGARAGDRVADVGSGPGVIARRLADHGARVTAIDLHADALALLPPDPRVATLVHDVERAPLPPPRYDVAFLLDVLHHAPDPVRMLRHLRESARTLALAEFDADGPGAFGPPPEARIPRPRLRAWLRDAGWNAAEMVALPFEHCATRAE